MQMLPRDQLEYMKDILYVSFLATIRIAEISPRQSVVHIQEVDYFVFSSIREVDCTHINDQHTK
jgi:hypothetical protein